MRAWALAALIVAGSLAGCADLLGFDGFVAGSPSAGSDAGEPDAGAEADWYVSALGDDANDGSRTRPLRTLQRAALLAGKALGEGAAAPQKIAVCAGEYRERDVLIEGPLEIRGGYDCASWMRPGSNDDVIGTSFESSSTLVNAARVDTFVALRESDSGAPRLDGLSVQGHEVSLVVDVSGNATLTNLSILNDTVPAPNGVDLPLGALLLSSSNATVEHCNLRVRQDYGKNGTEDSIAIGAAIFGGGPKLRRNRILVDSVAGLCEGILTSGATAAELTENHVFLASCIASDEDAEPTKSAAVGHVASDSFVKSIRNAIQIDTPGTTGSTAVVAGINVIGDGSFESDGDRVMGPLRLHETSTTDSLTFYGFRGGAALTSVVNASIVLDSRQYVLDRSFGILFNEASSSLLAHNSMYFSAPPSPDVGGVPVRAIYLSDEALAGGKSAVIVTSNLVVSDDSRTTFLRASCSVAGLGGVSYNRYAGITAPATGISCSSGTIEELESGVAPIDNVTFSCPAEDCSGLFENGVNLASVATHGLPLSTKKACGLQLEIPGASGVVNDGAGRPRGDAGTVAGAYPLVCN